jgi:hypothetical protein
MVIRVVRVVQRTRGNPVGCFAAISYIRYEIVRTR